MKISVIIRTYNSVDFVTAAVDSAFNQTLDKGLYEVLVVDDGSRDNTVEILRKKYGESIRIIVKENEGHTPTANRGITESQGEYVTLLDADDVFKPEMLKTMLQVFEQDPSLDFAYCDYIEKNGVAEKTISLKDNIFDTLATAIVFKKSLFEELGPYDNSMFFAEYDFLIRILDAGKKGKHISIPLYVYVRTADSLTFDKKRVEKGIQQLQEKYGDIANKIRKY